MDFNIMTWNTQMFEMGNKLKNDQIDIKPIEFSIYKFAIEKIDEHLKKKNAIVILEEIPFYCWEDGKEHVLFTMFKAHYKGTKYKLLYNIINKHQIKMTVVIAEKDIIDKDEKGICSNLFVSFKILNTDLYVLAVHSHNALELWNKISTSKDYSPQIILGDFNVGNYLTNDKERNCKMADNRHYYLMLLNGYIDICQGQYTTKYKSQIDHVLLKNSEAFWENYNFKSVMINRNIKISDHYPITFILTTTSGAYK